MSIDLDGKALFPGLYGRLGTRYAIRATGVPALPRSRWTFGLSGQNRGSSNTTGLPVARLRGRHLLDHEALTCLLVLLFMDEPKLNTTRLFRVLRNLCYHAPTRTWILRALLSILQRTSECQSEGEDAGTVGGTRTSQGGVVVVSEKGSKGRKGQAAVVVSPVDPVPAGSGWSRSDAMVRSPGSWLSISLEAALGCRANVFQVQRASGGKKSSVVPAQGNGVHIHPQAAPVVCRHVLDTLISLAKIFPTHFLPAPKVKEVPSCEAKEERDSEQGAIPTPTPTPTPPASGGARPKTQTGALSPRLARSDRSSSALSTPDHSRSQESDFWSLLLKLDGANQGRKGKGVQRAHSSLASLHTESEAFGSDYKSSALGQLMAMLSHPVVRRSQQLTDRLLRLLGLISVGVQDSASTTAASLLTTAAVTTTTTTTTTSSSTQAAVTVTPAVAPVTPAICLTGSSDSTQPSAPSAEAAIASPEGEAKVPSDSKPAEG